MSEPTAAPATPMTERPPRRHLTVVDGRQPPNDPAAEEAVLGAALLSTAAAEQAVAALTPDAFYRPAHQHIFQAVANLVVAGHKADPVTVADQLRRHNQLDQLPDGPAYLLHLQIATPGTGNIDHWARIVADRHHDRRRLHLADEIRNAIYTGRPDLVPTHIAELEAVGATHSNTFTTEDIGALMQADRPDIHPELLLRADRHGILLRGAVHLLHGEPSAGKSWVCAEAVRQAVAVGDRCVYIDYENSGLLLSDRLRAMGADPHAVTAHLVYFQARGKIPFHLLARFAAGHQPALCILDGFAAALGDAGLDEDNAADCLQLLRGLARPIADAGAAVVVVDHVTKDREGRGRWARGSGAKIGEVDAAFSLEMVEPFKRHLDGSSNLIVSKPDRYGAIGAMRERVATVQFRTVAEGIEVDLEPPADSGAYTGPTHAMDAVLQVLQARPDDELSGKEIFSAARIIGHRFRDETFREAAERLAADPDQPVSRRRGSGRTFLYRYDPRAAGIGGGIHRYEEEELA